ncbi:MAG TPA: hypothetical protein VIM69_09500, partial [Opitutaceae bacterium]
MQYTNKEIPNQSYKQDAVDRGARRSSPRSVFEWPIKPNFIEPRHPNGIRRSHRRAAPSLPDRVSDR